MREEPGRADALWTGMVFVVALLFQLPIFDRWMALLDEGYILAIADDVNHGAVLYRDVVVDAPLPGAFWLLAWWQRVTEPSVLSSRWLAMLGFAAYAAGLFRIARTLAPLWWSLALVVALLSYRVWAFPHWQVYSYSLVSATAAVGAAALVARGLRHGTRLSLLLGGLCAGVSILSKQDYGGMVAFALTLVLAAWPWLRDSEPRTLVARAQPAVLFMAGGAALILPTFAWMAAQGAFLPMIQQAVVQPLQGAIGFANYPRLPDLWPLFAQDENLRAQIGNYFPSILATLWWTECDGCWVSGLGSGTVYRDTILWDLGLKVVYWSPVFITVVVGAPVLLAPLVERLRAGRAADAAPPGLVAAALAVGFLLAFSRPRDWVHLMMVFPPTTLVLGVAALSRVETRLPEGGARLLRGGVAVALGILSFVTLALMDDLRGQVDHRLASPRAGVHTDRANGPLLDDVLAWVDRNVDEGELLPVWPIYPMVTFLSDQRPAAGFHVIWPVQAAERDGQIIAEMERREVRNVLFGVSQWGHLSRFQDIAPELFGHLVDHFEITQVFSREPVGPIMVALGPETNDPDDIPLWALDPDSAPPEEKWLFADVLPQPIGPRMAPGTISFRVRVPPERPVLRTAVGINPDEWFGPPTGLVTFALSMSMPGDAEGLTLNRGGLDARVRVEDRRWQPIVLDLSSQAGREVELTFSAVADDPTVYPESFIGWQRPRFGIADDPPRS